ncbi:hypothetical protein ES703_79429 [subsurface metagenome]
MAIAILDNPNEDGYLSWNGSVYTRSNALEFISYGALCGAMLWTSDHRAYVEWDISSLAGGTLTANPIFKYHGKVVSATDEEINPLLEEAPSGATDANLYGYIATGVAYVNPFNHEVGETKQVDLGAAARADLQAAMDIAQAWFAIGFQSPADEGAAEMTALLSELYSEEAAEPAANPKPTLYVEYTLPAVGLETKSGNIAAKMVEAGLI